MSMINKTFTNEGLKIPLNSYLDEKNNVWFIGKDIAEILGYRDTSTNQAIRKNV